MTRNRRVKVVLTPLQNEIIENRAESLGYKNKNVFARDIIFDDSSIVEKMIDDICKKVKFEYLKKIEEGKEENESSNLL